MKRLLRLIVGVVFLSITGYATESTTIPWNDIKDKKVTVLQAGEPININEMNDFCEKIGWDWNSYNKKSS